MYLHLFSSTSQPVSAKQYTPTTTAQRSMNSTSVPLARMYGSSLKELDSRSGFNGERRLKRFDWQPVCCGEVTVYVRARVS